MKQKLKLEIGCRVVVLPTLPKGYSLRCIIGQECTVTEIFNADIHDFMHTGGKVKNNTVGIKHGVFICYINRKHIRIVQAAPEEAK